MFSISIKGILSVDNKYLLRENERNEYELIGGKLEYTDEEIANRLTQEFIEESGIKIEPLRVLEPWFYVIGRKSSLIIPMTCRAIEFPQRLYDHDGGKLEYIEKDKVDAINIPTGYLESINNQIPSISFTNVKKDQVEYSDAKFNVFAQIKANDETTNFEMKNPCCIRILLMNAGYNNVNFLGIKLENDNVFIQYKG